MSSSSVVTLVTLGLNSIQDTLTTLAPVLIPIAIATTMFFAIWYWVRGASHRRV